jgi:hypothetical protein
MRSDGGSETVILKRQARSVSNGDGRGRPARVDDESSQHLPRNVDAYDRHACTDQRQRYATRTDTDLQAATVLGYLGEQQRYEARHQRFRERAGSVVVIRGAVEGDRLSQMRRPAAAQ